MTINNNAELTQIFSTLREYVRNISIDEHNALADELFRAVTDCMYISEKLDTYDSEAVRHTKEMYYYKSFERFNERLQEDVLCFSSVFSLNDFDEAVHVYEITAVRELDYQRDFTFTSQVFVMTDFDLSKCKNREYRETFDEEMYSLLLDIRYNTLRYKIKQLS